MKTLTKNELEKLKSGKKGINKFLFLFSLPFLAVGLGTGYFFFSKVLGAEGFASNLIPVLVFSLIFTTSGLFLMFKVPKLTGNVIQQLEDKNDGDRHEGFSKPWLENKQWATGKIECSNQGAMWGVWIFAVIWSGVSFPATYQPLMEAYEYQQYSSFFIAIFPLIGLLLLISAIWMTIRWRKFGGSVFEISNQTGYVGGDIKGVIRTATQVGASGDFILRLKCIERITTGSGKNRSTTAHTRWKDEKNISYNGVNSRMGIPVSFAIPTTCMETDDDSATGVVSWSLEIYAPVQGVDYSADFTVPVYKRPQEAA